MHIVVLRTACPKRSHEADTSLENCNRRTHFYAINETRPMERKVFNKLHKDLKSRSVSRQINSLTKRQFTD
jgi:hypothetical protein